MSANGNSLISTENQNWLIDELFGHKKEFINDFFLEKGSRYGYSSYNKEQLKEKILESLQEGSFAVNDLIYLLDKIEEFGRQHIYLYQYNANLIDALKDQSFIRELLSEKGIEHVLNSSESLLFPERPTLVSVNHNSDYLKFKWILINEYHKYLREERTNSHIIKYYKVIKTRDIRSFRIDLNTGWADLMIKKLHRGSKYRFIEEQLLQEINQFIDIRNLMPIQVKRAIKPLNESSEVRIRKEKMQTLGGCHIEFTSPSRGSDLRDETSVRTHRNNLGRTSSSSFGNYYWYSTAQLEQETHVTIYGNDNRVGIHRQCYEKEVDYVLSRIRALAE